MSYSSCMSYDFVEIGFLGGADVALDQPLSLFGQTFLATIVNLYGLSYQSYFLTQDSQESKKYYFAKTRSDLIPEEWFDAVLNKGVNTFFERLQGQAKIGCNLLNIFKRDFSKISRVFRKNLDTLNGNKDSDSFSDDHIKLFLLNVRIKLEQSLDIADKALEAYLSETDEVHELKNWKHSDQYFKINMAAPTVRNWKDGFDLSGSHFIDTHPTQFVKPADSSKLMCELIGGRVAQFLLGPEQSSYVSTYDKEHIAKSFVPHSRVPESFTFQHSQDHIQLMVYSLLTSDDDAIGITNSYQIGHNIHYANKRAITIDYDHFGCGDPKVLAKILQAVQSVFEDTPVAMTPSPAPTSESDFDYDRLHFEALVNLSDESQREQLKVFTLATIDSFIDVSRHIIEHLECNNILNRTERNVLIVSIKRNVDDLSLKFGRRSPFKEDARGNEDEVKSTDDFFELYHSIRQSPEYTRQKSDIIETLSKRLPNLSDLYIFDQKAPVTQYTYIADPLSQQKIAKKRGVQITPQEQVVSSSLFAYERHKGWGRRYLPGRSSESSQIQMLKQKLKQDDISYSDIYEHVIEIMADRLKKEENPFDFKKLSNKQMIVIAATAYAYHSRSHGGVGLDITRWGTAKQNIHNFFIQKSDHFEDYKPGSKVVCQSSDIIKANSLFHKVKALENHNVMGIFEELSQMGNTIKGRKKDLTKGWSLKSIWRKFHGIDGMDRILALTAIAKNDKQRISPKSLLLRLIMILEEKCLTGAADTRKIYSQNLNVASVFLDQATEQASTRAQSDYIKRYSSAFVVDRT